MMAGRFLRISPPIEGSKLTHQTSPRFMGAIPESSLRPFQCLRFPNLILSHHLVFGVQLRPNDVRSHQFLDELADLARPNHVVQALIDLFINRDRQFLLHDEPPTIVIRILYVYCPFPSTPFDLPECEPNAPLQPRTLSEKEASRQLQAVVGQHVVGSIGVLLLDNPIRNHSYNLLLY